MLDISDNHRPVAGYINICPSVRLCNYAICIAIHIVQGVAIVYKEAANGCVFMCGKLQLNKETASG